MSSTSDRNRQQKLNSQNQKVVKKNQGNQVKHLNSSQYTGSSDFDEQDHQGIRWKDMGYTSRSVYRQRREAQYVPFRDNMHQPMPKYPKQEILQQNAYSFSKYFQDLQIKICHFQLRYCIKAISPYDVVYVEPRGLGLLNTLSSENYKTDLKYGMNPTMINSQDNILALAGLDGDVTLLDTRNFSHINHFTAANEDNIVNYVGFISNSALQPQSYKNTTQQLYQNQSRSSEILQEQKELEEEEKCESKQQYQQKFQQFQQQNQQQKQQQQYNNNNNNNPSDWMDIEFQASSDCTYNNNNFPQRRGMGNYRKNSSIGNMESLVQDKLNMKQSILNDLDVKLLTCSNDRHLKIFDLEKSKEITDASFLSAPNVAAYNPQRQVIAIQCDSVNTEILDARSLNNIMYLKGHEDYGFSIDWNPNWNEVATGNQDGTVRIYDIRNGKCLKVLQGELGHTCCLEYTDKHLIVGEGIDYVHIFDYQRDYLQQSIDFFGELNGISCFQDDIFFGVSIVDYAGIFQYSQNKPQVQILEEEEELFF